jgi:acyl-CoA thioester hydrolase
MLEQAPFQKEFFARWSDMDFNAHMKNTAYLDYSADLRMAYFQANGFSMAEFSKAQFGPLIFQDEIRYFKEIHLLDAFTGNLQVAALNEDGSRFTFQNEFFRADGKKAALVLSQGAWIDLKSRKLTAPPPALVEVMRRLPRVAEPTRSDN